MTREEKLKLLNRLLEIEEKNDIGNLTTTERREFQQWFEVLEQEPCEKTQMVDKSTFSQEQYRADLQSAFDCGKASADCEDAISRQAARKIILDEFEGWPTDEEVAQLKRLTKQIDELPSVTPKQKMGHWIHFAWSDDCSECGWSTGKYESPTKYCPNCGAKMGESEE